VTDATLDDPLVLAFAARRPEELAAALADAGTADLADFITSLPRGTDARIAARLPSWQLGGLLSTLHPRAVCSMLLGAAIDDAVAIVAHLPQSAGPAVLAACPEQRRQWLRQLLEYPTHSIASLATTNFIRVAGDVRCASFAEQLAERSEASPEPILVVDAQGHYLGLLSPQTLFRRRNASRNTADIAVAVPPLNGETDAATAMQSRQWAQYTELPVIDRQRRVLGVVSRAALLRVVGDAQPPALTLERLFAELATNYFDTCSHLVETLLGRPR